MRSLLLCLCYLIISLAGGPMAVAQDDLLDELDEAIFDHDDTWWNDDWRYRRRVDLIDPRRKVRTSNFIRLEAPEPLFLYNLGRAQAQMRDIRIVTADRRLLTGGIVNWGIDDGSSHLWVKLPAPQHEAMSETAPIRLMLYYGYDGDETLPAPPDAPLLELRADPYKLVLGEEEVRPGATAEPWPDPEAFFRDLVVVEAERFTDERGHDGFVHSRMPDRRTYAIGNLQPASGGLYMAPDMAWRHQHEDYPVTVRGSAILPSAGTWYVHLRYPVSQYVFYHNTLTPKRTHYRFHPYEVRIGEHTLTVGEDQAPGAAFRYTSAALELPAGETPIAVTWNQVGGLDCIVFTRDPDYRPDIRDINGPVHMRYTITDAPLERFIVAPYCVNIPWSSSGAQGEYAGYLFRDLVAPTPVDLNIAQRDPENLLRVGDTTPWIQMLTSQMPTWWTMVQLLPPGPGRSVAGGTYRFEFATRPHPARVFRRGEETAELSQGLFVLMPSSLDLQTTLTRTLSFGQWAEQRFERVGELDLTVEQRPEEILVTSMATSVSGQEAEYILRTLAALGFNGAEVRAPLTFQEYWAMSNTYGMNWATTHHWHPKVDYAAWPEAPPEGTSAEQQSKALIDATARYTYAPDGARWREETPHIRLLIMGDEIGPATNAPMINTIPLQKGWFHEYLQAQGLTPDFFGHESWETIEALWYREVSPTSELGESIRRIREARGLPNADPYAPDAPSAPEHSLEDAVPSATALELLEAMSEEEDARQAAARTAHGPREADLHEKRLYHWSQHFRSHYTNYVYGTSMREIRRQTELGNFHTLPYSSPNFQALPIMRTQMWDGGLNLFAWARDNTTNTLMIEDWIVHPYRVGFGFQLLRSAARKHDQHLGFLVVGGNMNQRYYAALANGARVFLSYLYGPLRVIGPPWAEHEPTMRQWSSALSTTAAIEDELLASTPRPARAALLVAVTSDINAAYINPNPIGYQMGDRASVYAALQDSQVPVEIISEEELLEEPDALDRYRVLYVVDPHVDSRVQETIRAWVEGGGYLWGNYMAMARQEYDVTTERMLPVFGLTSRAPLPDLERNSDWQANAPTLVVPPESQALTPVAFPATPVPTEWQVAEDAEVLARFADGAPAFIRHGYGKGRAYLLASTAYPLTGGYGRESEEPAFAAAARRLIALPTREAGLEPHLSLDHPRIMSYVNDGEQQSLAFLINCYEADIERVTARVKLPRRPKAAEIANHGPVEWRWHDGEAEVSLAIPKLDGRIVVFRY